MKVGTIVGSKVQHIYLVAFLVCKNGVVVRRCNTRHGVFLDGELLAIFVGVCLQILRRGIYAMDGSPSVDAVLRIEPIAERMVATWLKLNVAVDVFGGSSHAKGGERV